LGGITAHFQKVKGRLLWTVLGSLALFSPVRAATDVSGPIVTDEVWTLAQSPYTVTGDILVQNGAILTIEPGVVVRLNADKNLLVEAGVLSARGNVQSPIVFTSFKDDGVLTAAAGDWGQLRFLDGTDDAATIIEHVHVRYGYGIAIDSASPTINYATIANNAAAAITLDLNSSPRGIGNSASGNALNGISVPPGNIVSSVAWKLKGLPYVVSLGTVSVGQPPVIATLTPSEIQQGETLEMTLTGSRLQSVERIAFDDASVTALVLSETEAAANLRVTAAASAAIGVHGVEVQIAGGVARLDGALNVIAPKPSIIVTSIEPPSIRPGETNIFNVTGANFGGVKATTSDPGLIVNQVVVASDGLSLSLSLTALSSLPAGTQTLTFTNNSVSGASASIDIDVLAPPPALYVSPAPLGVPPDSTAREFALKLTAPDTVDHTIELSVTDPTIATVSPASIVIAAGQTQATFALNGLSGEKETTLTLTSMTLGSTAAPVYVLAEFANARTGFSKPLGIVVGGETPTTETITPASRALGIVVEDPAETQPQSVDALASTALGVVVEETTAVAPTNINSLAASELGVVVEEAATPVTQAVFLGTARLGIAVDFAALSIEPSTMVVNTSGTLIVHGIGLTAATAVNVVPSDGITLGMFEVSVDGSQITVPVTVDGTAPATARAVVVETASGRIEFANPAANQLLITAQ
jgi:hypothetical protein